MLERRAVKVACAVLRGRGGGDTALLPGGVLPQPVPAEPQKWYNALQYPVSGECRMNFPALSQIEEHIAQLSLDEQLWLIARVAHRLRAQLVTQSPLDAQLAAMAADPEVQNELRAIAEEFAYAEADGLAPE